MARTWTLPLALLVATGLAAQENRTAQSADTRTLIINFPLASAELGAVEAATLRALCDRVEAARVTGITLKGHTDTRGSEAYNLALSERRAEAVKAALAGTCLKDVPVSVDWSGEAEPLRDGNSEPAHADNRRVEVALRFAAEKASRTPHHSKVTALIPSCDKPQEIVLVDPTRAIDRVMSDGTRLRIPANAIVDANGDRVAGDVRIHYRGFTDPYEIIASGIPMHIATPDGIEHFETAGMYEVYATQGDQTLALAPGSSMELIPAGTPQLTPDYGPYVLDANTGAWTSGGSLTTASGLFTPVASNTGTSTGATAATTIYWNRLGELRGEEEPDSTLFAVRRASSDYCHMERCDRATTSRRGLFKRRVSTIFPASVPNISVKGYKGIYEEHDPVFMIEMGKDDDLALPEWRRLPYKAVWRYAGTENRAVFKRLFGGRHHYQDIALDMEPGSTTGVLRLKENGTWVELPVSAELNIHNEQEARRWNMALEFYQRALKKREVRFDRYVTQTARRYWSRRVNVKETAWKAARPRMTAEEATLDLAAWEAYAATRRPRMNLFGDSTQQAAFASIQTTFNLDGFGIYNIDRIMKMQEQQQVLATTRGPDGAAFPWVVAYAVLLTEKSVITYWGNGTGVGNNMLVAPGRMKSLFLVDKDGTIARCDVSALNTGAPRAELPFTLLEKPGSVEDLKEVASLR